MKPGSGRRPAAQETSITAARLERLAVPLTVLHANIQLLQRRVRKGTMPEPDALLRALDKLEGASRTLAAELRELDELVSTARPVRETIQENRSSAVHEPGERDI